ncbi:50S ribosomal protein L18e [Candidatus Micrarchaeota archaeon]|nr:50S ribosomal protein L18e [Candidatus Micrarchaeota archaeon]
MKKGPENPVVQRLIVVLEKASKKNKAGIWKRAAELLKKSSRRRVQVNLYKIDKHSSEGDTILVPGKVLGVGEIKKGILVVALDFSASAKAKIEKSGGSISGIEKLVEISPKGTGVKILM